MDEKMDEAYCEGFIEAWNAHAEANRNNALDALVEGYEDGMLSMSKEHREEGHRRFFRRVRELMRG